MNYLPIACIVPKKRLKKDVETGFIPGIYNYCDRWCEKCDQQLHCVSYVMGKRLKGKGEISLDVDFTEGSDGFWGKLRQVFESTVEVLHELAKERGVNVEDIYAPESIGMDFLEEELENNGQEENYGGHSDPPEIVKICMIYENLAGQCIEGIFRFLESGNDDLPDGTADDAIETVNRYLDLIQTKLRRALHWLYLHETPPASGTEDYNGPAKVALIAAERSLRSWRLLGKTFSRFKREITHITVVLEELLDDIEKTFPEARDFKRPGFEQKA